MIAFLRGTFVGRSLSEAYIDVQGVGYGVSMSQNSLSKLPTPGEEVTVKTFINVSDNGIALFGFMSDSEQALFEKLITINGVGPKMALAALSTFTPEALAEAIAAQDSALISKIPGVGKKTASRIILELKGYLDEGLGGMFADQGITPENTASAGATEALLSMGFSSAEAEVALKGAPDGASEEDLLKYALKRIGGAA